MRTKTAIRFAGAIVATAYAVICAAVRVSAQDDDGDDVSVCVANVGDVNGDGKSDFAVGARFPGSGGPKALGVVKVFSGKDGSVLLTLKGSGATEAFGDSVGAAGDVNGDGRPDVVVGAKNADVGSIKTAGQARVFSGKDGSLLLTFDGKIAEGDFGWCVAGAGDVDRDGRGDVAVGAIDSGSEGGGTVTLFSGKSGQALLTIDRAKSGDLFGAAVAPTGDLNGDGVPDFAATSRGNGGSVTAVSGNDGAALWTVKGKPDPDDELGFSLAAAGDLNGDGVVDLVACAWSASPGKSKEAGEVRAFSGKDGAPLWTAPGLAADEHFGEALAGVGDVDGDGRPDVAASSPWAGEAAGVVRILSGKDGAVLRTFPGGDVGQFFGFALAAAGDVNGDKVADVLVGASGRVVEKDGRTWQARVLSGKDGKVLLTLDGSAAR